MFIIDGLVGLWFQLHFQQYFSYIVVVEETRVPGENH
jgi:hypothetical protein